MRASALISAQFHLLRVFMPGARFSSLSLRPPLAAVALLLAAMLIATQVAWGRDGYLAAGALLALGLCWGSVIDIDRMMLPDAITLGLAGVGLAVSLAGGSHAFVSSAIGCAVGLLVSLGLAEGYRRLRGRDGLGGGDIKLLAAAGAWLGWEGLPAAVLIATSAAIVFILGGAALRRRRPDAAGQIAFGPFIAVGIWVVWLGGASVLGVLAFR
ncbi:MAG: A24 family peptidase [Hyphomonadaceae bacterium]